LFTRSNGFVDQVLFQWLNGKAANAVTSAFASRSIAATAGNRGSSLAATSSSWSRTAAGSGWLQIVRMSARTISAQPFGRRDRTLRRK
jgi:hypothetical protein